MENYEFVLYTGFLLVCIVWVGNAANENCKEDGPACLPGWKATRLPRTCIQIRKKNLKWKEARKDCQKDGADLAIVYSINHLYSFEAVLKNLGFESLWIGLHTKEFQLQWNRGDVDIPPLERWDPVDNYPKLNYLPEACVTIRTDNLLWRDHICDQQFRFVCESGYDTDGSCPYRWFMYEPTKKCLSISEDKKTWSEALAYCEGRPVPGKLITFKDELTLEGLRELLAPRTVFFVGLFRVPETKELIWLDHKGFKASFVSWSNNEPQNRTGEDCIGLSLAGTFEDHKCILRANHICQMWSPLGPTASPQMDIKFDRPGNTAFFNSSLMLRCSIDGPMDQGIMWFMVKDGKNVDFNDLIVSAHQTRLRGDNGTCFYRTTMTYDLLVEDYMVGALFYCLAYIVADKVTCDLATNEPLCNKTSAPLQVARGPRRPKMKIKYNQPPSTMYAGSTITASCDGYVGSEDIFMWILYTNRNPSIIKENDTRIIEEKRIKRNDAARGPHVFSVVRMKATPELSGMELACYTINATKYAQDNMMCPWPYNFCAKSRIITIQGGFWQTYWRYILLGILVFLVLLGLILYRRESLYGGEGEDVLSPAQAKQSVWSVKGSLWGPELPDQVEKPASEQGRNSAGSGSRSRTKSTSSRPSTATQGSGSLQYSAKGTQYSAQT